MNVIGVRPGRRPVGVGDLAEVVNQHHPIALPDTQGFVADVAEVKGHLRNGVHLRRAGYGGDDEEQCGKDGFGANHEVCAADVMRLSAGDAARSRLMTTTVMSSACGAPCA